jgi:hypothetical protein
VWRLTNAKLLQNCVLYEMYASALHRRGYG